jgi:crossover junction endodeoxyribonuclease RuvC
MLILGIDPGSLHTGYGAVRKDGPSLVVVEAGTISPPARASSPERLLHLSRGIVEVAERLRPETAVLETPFYGLNVRSLIVLAQARGALVAALAGCGIEIREFTPAEVKSAVTGNGRAGKGDVARMVRLLLSFQEDCSEDATDALAVAVCCAQRLRMDRISALHGRAKQP